MSTDNPDWVPPEVLEPRRMLYQPGEAVWVGRSRGSEREAIVVRYLGEGFYRVYVAAGGKEYEPSMKTSFTRVEKEEAKRAEVPALVHPTAQRNFPKRVRATL